MGSRTDDAYERTREEEMRALPWQKRVNWRNLLWLTATILLSLIIAGVWTIATAAERFEGQPEVVDADTFRFGGTKVRLWGVDAPESGQTCLDAAGKQYLCGSKAALALADWIGRRRISCQQGYGSLAMPGVCLSFTLGMTARSRGGAKRSVR